MEFTDLPIDNESKRFKNHLIHRDNNRLIFSGIFGIGKTYFIDKFFNNNVKEFITIKLNPVNYSVSQNEDIFELIKFDIAFQLFSKNPQFEKIDFSKSFAAQFYTVENYKSVIKSLAINLTKLDRRIETIAHSVLSLNNKVQEFKENIETDEKEELKQFLEIFKLQSGTPREEDSITELITCLLEVLKENNSELKTVLIIDDLDRIDPGHIFRILNVFSAHLDYYSLKEEDNKFGFDKILLICDIENIRGIFSHQYGTHADFNGYIDKFYSIEIFNYNFTGIIINSLNKFYRSLRSDNAKLGTYLKSSETNYYTKELTFILRPLIEVHAISMRMLINFLKSELNLPNYKIKTVAGRTIHSSETPFLTVLQILERLFGGKRNLLQAINKVIALHPLVEVIAYDDYWDTRIGNVVMLIDHKNTNLDFSKETQHYLNEDLDFKAEYKIEPTDGFYGAYGRASKFGAYEEIIDEGETQFIIRLSGTKVPYFQLLKRAIESLIYLNKEID